MFHQDLLDRMFHKNFARSEDKNALKILQNPQETPLCNVRGVYSIMTL